MSVSQGAFPRSRFDAKPFRAVSFALAVALGALPVVTAQEDPEAEKQPAVVGPQGPGGETPEAGAATESPVAEASTPSTGTPSEAAQLASFLTVRRPALPLRGRPLEAVPGFPGELAVGDIVWADGPVDNDFQPVRIPGGVMGYVHSRFVELQPDGRVRVDDSGVPLRHQPKGGIAPIVTLTRGAELWIVGDEEGGWLKVREPGRRVYLPADAVSPAPTDATSKAVVDDAKARAEGLTQAYLDHLANLTALAEAREMRQKQAAEIRREFNSVILADPSSEDWAPLKADLREWLAAASPEEPDYRGLENLRDRILDQERVQKRIEKLEVEQIEWERDLDDALEVVDIGRPKPSPMSDYEQGYLRADRSIFSGVRYWLERGGKEICVVTCDNGRYSLEDFVDHHVAVNTMGRENPADESISIDVARHRAIYVLGR
ncbi:MAG: hypothetical protein AAF196_19590 [Planctomycetota bacterium]